MTTPSSKDAVARTAALIADRLRGRVSPSSTDVEAGRRGLLDVFDVRHNLRGIAKELLLLEDHLAHPAQRCPDCIRKHLLRAEALAEEAIQLDERGEREDLVPLPGTIRDLQRAWIAKSDPRALQQRIRTLRKALSKEAFEALAFRSTGESEPRIGGTRTSTNRISTVFALDRDAGAPPRARAAVEASLPGGSAAREVPLSDLPSTIVATLRRRLADPLDADHPAPILYRVARDDGNVDLREGRAFGRDGDTLLVMSGAARVRVPIRDAVLDLGADPAYRAIAWPTRLTLDRDGAVDDLALTPEHDRIIRAMASAIWPVVDGFVLSVAPTPEARRAILQRLLQAAVVNAAYESSLLPGAVGDRGRAVGLFQLRDDGAGARLSARDRKDPLQNSARIAQRFLEVRKFFSDLAAAEGAAPGSTSPGAWAGLFGRVVEAPRDRDRAERVRGATAAAAFPLLPALPRVAPRPIPVSSNPEPEVPAAVWVLGGLAAGAAGVATVWWWMGRGGA